MALSGVIGDDQATLALGFLTEADRAGVLGHDRRILRLASLEQVGNTRQTTGNVTRLRRFLRNSCDDVTDGYLRTVRHADDGANRQCVNRRDFRVREAHVVAVFIDETSNRAQVLACTTAALRIEYDN